MKISKIVINNFRCYYGKHTVEFSTDGKITLIYGLSGAGKTSFLQFINWVLYNKNDFVIENADGKKIEDFPIYNMKLEAETDKGSTFEVKGSIDFTHNGIDYEIIRKETYRKTSFSCLREDSDVVLMYSENGNWVNYTDDIANKINEIVPRALSKYFFFHGEKMDLLNTEDSDLKQAIYKLFGLNKYEEALSHLGDKKTSQTVIYKYYNEKNKHIKGIGEKNPQELFNYMVKCNEKAKEYKGNSEFFESREKYFSGQTKELLEKISQKKSSGAYESNIKTNNQLIKSYEQQIQDKKYCLGKCLYTTIPYLILSDLTKNSVKLLASEVNTQETRKSVIFKNLKKDLLKEILEKGVCVCNRELDESAIAHIKTTIGSMPPDSYVYQLKQFASKSSDYIKLSQTDYDNFELYLAKITELRNKILDLNDANKKITEELKKVEDTKELALKYDHAFKKTKEYSHNKNEAIKEEKKYSDFAKKYETEYEKAVDNTKIKEKYDEKIELLEKIRYLINREFEKKIDTTISTLEKSILEIYGILSTRTEDFENISFLNEDFSLRKVSRTGGQEAIDVYSYIIGMIKALHQLNSGSNEKEFPIIIDAPFSHTDVIQANHVFDTLPEIAPQVIILSLELDKFRSSIVDSRVGNTYVINSNDRQNMATITKCSIKELFDIENQNVSKTNIKETK